MTVDRLVSVKEACRLLAMGQTKLYSEVAAGRLQMRKAGRRSVIAESEISRFQQSLPVVGRQDAA
jgi:excisionase family DNA binding protein